MSWRKYLLVPRLAATGLRQRPDPGEAWQSYWSGVARTGPDGDVLWDGAGEQELRWWRDITRRHFDRTLPVLDVGCGNGRLSRLLAGDYPRVLGIDVSPAAVELARQETRDVDRIAFRQLDITADQAGDDLAGELGAANVVVRGVLHILDEEEQRRAVAALAAVLRDRGPWCSWRRTGRATLSDTWSTSAGTAAGCRRPSTGSSGSACPVLRRSDPGR